MRGRLQTVEPHRLRHRLAARVHIGRGLQQQDSPAVDGSLYKGAVKLAAGNSAGGVPACQPIKDDGADVVAAPVVPAARIAQTHDELHVHVPAFFFCSSDLASVMTSGSVVAGATSTSSVTASSR